MQPRASLVAHLDAARIRRYAYPSAAIGLALTGFSLHLAIVRQNPTWYTPFVVGSYLLFGAINCLLRGRSTLVVAVVHTKRFLQLYTILMLLGFIIDLLLGRLLGDFWIYPSLSRLDQVIHVWLLGYPLALLSAVESLWLLQYPPPISADRAEPQRRSRIRTGCSRILLSTTVLLFAAAIALRVNGDLEAARKAMFFLLFTGAFSFDALAFLLGKISLVGSVTIRGLPRLFYLAALVPVIGFLHEFPNSYAHEWVYQHIPFVHSEVAGVNILVLTAGWLFLLLMPLSLTYILLPAELVPATWETNQ